MIRPRARRGAVLFRLEGFQTRFALDLETFFSLPDRRRSDVFILNMQDHGSSTLDALKRIKNMRTGTPVFMVANNENVTEAVTAMKLGATDIIAKPFDTERFVQAVRDALWRDVHLGAVQGGRAGNWASARAPSRCTGPASWKSWARATPPI